MQLKTAEINGAVYAEVRDGKPVYVHDDGKEVPFDAQGTIKTINDRGAEARDRRIEKEQAEARLKMFEGIDPEAARKALETMSNLDAKKLIDAGEVDKVRSAAKTEFDRQVEALKKEYEPHLKERDSLRHQLDTFRLDTQFNQSEFIKKRTAAPVSLLRAEFGRHFYFENGELYAKHQDGNPVFSRANPGNPAKFEEAIEILVDSHPDRDQILRGSGASGGGAGGTRTSGDGKRRITQAAFDRLSPADQMATALNGTEIVD